MIIDCHVHLNNYHVEQRGPTEQHLDQLRAQMEKWSLDQALVLTSYTVSQDRPSAARLLELIRDDPRIHIVEGIGVTGREPVDWDKVGQRLREGLTRGLKIYPGYEHAYPHDKLFQPGLELASKYHAPVMVHTGDTFAPTGKLKYAHPLHVDDVAVDYPDVNFIVCHLGSPWFHDTAELIYKNDNVYADISGLVLEQFSARLESFMREQLEQLILYSGEPDKLLYGTDWPLVRMGPYLRFVEQLALEPQDRALLMGGNAARLFRLAPVAPRPSPAPPGAEPSPAP